MKECNSTARWEATGLHLLGQILRFQCFGKALTDIILGKAIDFRPATGATLKLAFFSCIF